MEFIENCRSDVKNSCFRLPGSRTSFQIFR